MTALPLSNRRILVVEDEYFLADELRCELESAGATIVGPVGGILPALAAIDASQQLDGAILDVNLNGEKVFPAAQILQDRNVPILFLSGYDKAVIPQQFEIVPHCRKPVPVQEIITTLLHVMQVE
ncbi:MAG: response regulator [Erythrobacter sp.]|uniref:response regulator n=1 Tax=Erythrobacter sp. TaxID=1042 RepID=UPI0025FB6D0E|nr:response regulator [Erythrobacter sp.]MCL9998977.1 response regulator [Erythrobacter sp.]